MKELTKKCLAMSKQDRARLAQILTESLSREDRVDDGTRFGLLYKIATEMFGNGILTQNRDKDLVLGRRMIALKMRSEGYTLENIGKHLYRHHASIKHMVAMLEEALELEFQPECDLWNRFLSKLTEYEKEMESSMV